MSNHSLNWLILASALVATHPSPAVASYDRGICESNLLGELGRSPDDDNHGLVTDKVKMSPSTLISAYRMGIFPWNTTPEGNSVWHSPPERGVLAFDKIHISKKDRKFIERELNGGHYEVTIDKAFRDVITECAEMIRWRTAANNRNKVPDGQWISPQFIENYTALFNTGQAHSVEVWHDGILVAGLYGTFVQGVFAGESMFHKEADATKLALYVLIERLKANGHTFIDTQQSKGLVLKWGAEIVSRDDFLKMLRDAQKKNLPF